MVDISNKLQEAEISSSRYNYAPDPSAVANKAIGAALSGIGTIAEAGVKAVDTSIQEDIKTDLFNERDKADLELGIVGDTSAEESIDLPTSITDPMNKMANSKEAVNQGRMTETQFYNRMDSVVRQLRVKYPGYRDQIDKLAGQVLGFDPANAKRKQYFAEMDEATKTTAKQVSDDDTLLKDASKAGYVVSPLYIAKIAQNTPLNPEERAEVTKGFYELNAAKAQTESLDAVLKRTEGDLKFGAMKISENAGSLQTLAKQNIVKAVLPDGQLTTIDDLRAELSKDGLDEREAGFLYSYIQDLKNVARKSAIDYWSTQSGVPGKTFSSYVQKEEERLALYDGGLQTLIDLEKSIFGTDINDVALSKKRLELMENSLLFKMYSQDQVLAKVTALSKQLGWQNVFVANQGEVRDILTRAVGDALTIAATDGMSAMDVAEKGAKELTLMTPTQFKNGLFVLKDNALILAKENPEASMEQLEALFGLNKKGRSFLYMMNEKDRLKIYNEITSPDFVKFIKENATPEVKARFKEWQVASFRATFREDLDNVASIYNFDITGAQLSFDNENLFKLTPAKEEPYAQFAGKVMSTLTTGRLAFTTWENSINRMNKFIRTYISTLPDGLTDEQIAGEVGNLLASMNMEGEPNAAGGMWTKLAKAAVELASGDNQNQGTEATPPVGQQPTDQGVDVSPLSDTPTVSQDTPTPTDTQAQPDGANVTDVTEQSDTTAPGFFWPINAKISSPFGGDLYGDKNEGINFTAPEGSEVGSAEAGVVAYAGDELRGYGNLVIIRHSNGYVSAYAHLGSIDVKRGDVVKKGFKIGTVGQTGSVPEPQLHFEIRKEGKAIDPMRFLESLSSKPAKESSLIPDNVQIQPAADVTIQQMIENDFNMPSDTGNNPNVVTYGNASFEPAPKDIDFAIKTIYGEARGESAEGQQAVAEVIRNRAIASGKSMEEIVKAGDGSQFNAWKKNDVNYNETSTFSRDNKQYANIEKSFQAGMSSDITKGATHYYNPKTSNPYWKDLFVETVRIGDHRFGYLRKDDPFRKRLMKKIGDVNA